MIIKPIIRNNIALNSHPKGCEKNILMQYEEIKKLPDLNKKNLNVLIIGGSSGYGLASRIVLAAKANAFTYNVSTGQGPTKRLSGGAGYYNNYYFKKHFNNSVDLTADCFANETKDEVIKYFKENNKKIDLVIYSVASPVRLHPHTQQKYKSSIKPIHKDYEGHIVDLSKDQLQQINIEAANEEEIQNTIQVMGGEDYYFWMEALKEGNVLNEGVISLAYTYLGAPTTYPIYRDGTIGQAKRDLEAKNIEIDKILQDINGHSIIVSAKSIVSKASIFIPSVTLYISALYKVMKENNTHETPIIHIYRLFKDMIYGNKPLIDENGIYRLDSYELQPHVQKEVEKLLAATTPDNFQNILDYDSFKNDFLQLNGFGHDQVDYEKDVDLDLYM